MSCNETIGSFQTMIYLKLGALFGVIQCRNFKYQLKDVWIVSSQLHELQHCSYGTTTCYMGFGSFFHIQIQHTIKVLHHKYMH